MFALLHRLFQTPMAALAQRSLDRLSARSRWQPMAAGFAGTRPRPARLPAVFARAPARQAVASRTPRPFWISVDPQDPRRAVMSGTPREVCRVLDMLLAMEQHPHQAA